jgi:hypothetical protein
MYSLLPNYFGSKKMVIYLIYSETIHRADLAIMESVTQLKNDGHPHL